MKDNCYLLNCRQNLCDAIRLAKEDKDQRIVPVLIQALIELDAFRHGRLQKCDTCPDTNTDDHVPSKTEPEKKYLYINYYVRPSDTPRTDAAEFFVATPPKLSPDEGQMCVDSFLARQLERELKEMKAKNQRLLKRLELRLCCEPDGSPDEKFQYCSECLKDLALMQEN